MNFPAQQQQILAALERGCIDECSQKLKTLAAADILELWSEISDQEQQFQLFCALLPAARSPLLASLSGQEQEWLLYRLSNKASGDILSLMDPDDLVDLIQGVSAPIREAVLAHLEDDVRRECEFLFRFDAHDAAGLMTPRYAALRPSIKVAQALSFLRQNEQLQRLEIISYLYVLDPLKRLCGVVTLKKLLAANNQQLVAELMNPHCISIVAQENEQEVAAKLVKHNLIAIPVVDQAKRMLGIVTFDDVFDVLERQEKQHSYRMAGVQANSSGFLASSIAHLVWRRLPWLIALLVLGTLTTNVLDSYHELLLSFAFLPLFIPVITQTGGNTGGQSATLIIRDLVLIKKLNPKKIARFILKELVISSVLASIVAGIMTIRLIFLPPRLHWQEAMTVIIALSGVVVASSLLGLLVPLFLRLIGVDPAVAAGPILSTIVDLLGLSLYFGLASYLLLN